MYGRKKAFIITTAIMLVCSIVPRTHSSGKDIPLELLNTSLPGCKALVNRLPVEDPAKACALALDTWRSFCWQMKSLNIIPKTVEEEALNEKDILIEHEQQCPYFGLFEHASPRLYWQYTSQGDQPARNGAVTLMSDFTTKVVAHIVSRLESTQDRRLVVASIASGGFFTDLVVLAQVLEKVPNARICFVHNHYFFPIILQHMTKETEDRVSTQFFRWIKMYHPESSVLFMHRKAMIKKGRTVPVADFIYAREFSDYIYQTNEASHTHCVKKEFRNLCKATESQNPHFGALMIRDNGIGVKWYVGGTLRKSRNAP